MAKKIFFLENLVRATFILLMVCDGVCHTSSAACRLGSSLLLRPIGMKGDLILGGIFDIHILTQPHPPNFTKSLKQQKCLLSMLNEDFYNVLALVFAVDEINKNPKILPNITLGYYMFDSYVEGLRIIQSAFKLLSRSPERFLNYNCAKYTILAGVIEGLTPMFSVQLANILQIYRYPQISFTSQDLIQMDTNYFPYFYRTIPNEYILYNGIMEFLLYFNWRWIGIISPSDSSSINSVQYIKNRFSMYGICTEFILKVPFINDYNSLTVNKIKHTITKSTANVILVYGTKNNVFYFHVNTNIFNTSGKVWISTADTSFYILYNKYKAVSNGSLHFIARKKEIPDFLSFIKNVDPNRFPTGKTYVTWWDELCANRCPFTMKNRNCHGVEQARHLLNSHCNLKFQAMSYNVYNSVYALAYALHNLVLMNESIRKNLQDKYEKKSFLNISPHKLHYFLKKVDFINKLGDRIYFKNNEMSPEYDIYNLLYLPNGTLKANLVGNLSQSDPERIGLTIDADTITWDRSFSGIPKSTCANDCPPGFWKFRREGQAVCCFDCIPCPEGKVSPWTNSELCMFCPKEEWSNENKTQCIPKTISFLSYQDPLGIALTAIASGFSATSITILGIFLKYRETPIAKANNRTLSYILLTSITFSFLGSLFFIGQPHKWTCFLRQPIFGISFAIAVSSILAKSLTTVVAFNVHHPGRFIRSYVRVKTPILIVLICPCVQVLICFFWLVCSAPYPNYLNSGTKEIIFHCNEGSVLFFYLVLVYMCVLAGLSFILAFLSRSLPDTFNEAKYITFSMLMFFIVWISFILCYLSSKGKEVETLEIFAILTSNAALLICIFAPKLNIIILQPHKNNRKILHPIALKKYGQQK